MTPSPETSSKWLNLIMPLLVQAGPVLSLFLLFLGGLMIWWLLGDIRDQRHVNRVLYERLLGCYHACEKKPAALE